MNLTGQPPHQKETNHDEDKAYLAWLRTEASALSGRFPTVAAHFRTAKNSGTGVKPVLSAIPLTFDEHARQHQIGQYNFMPKEWWSTKAEFYVRKWREINACKSI